LLRVVKHIGTYNLVDVAFVTWLYRVASAVVRDDYQTRWQIPPRQSPLHGLTPEQRQFVVLRFTANMSLEEIAYILDTPIRTVGQLQLQALRALSSQPFHTLA
jgi:DNA-directed RNA polymerase specialized sigma24 family protein